MPRNSLSLTVRVGCKIYGIGFFDKFFKFRYKVSLSADGDILRFVVILDIDSEGALGQIANMALACCYFKIFTKEFFNCLNFCR